MADSFFRSIGARAASLAKMSGDAVHAVRPRWTYPKGPKSRADLMPREAASAPAPAKVKLRFEPRALFFGEGAARPRKLYAAGLEKSAAPDPQIVLARAPALRTLSPRQAEIERALRTEMPAHESGQSEDAAVIAGDIGQALLDRAIASSTESLARIALWGAGLGAVAFASGSVLSGGVDPFGYGAVYFGAGFIGALIISAITLAAGAGAKARFAKGQQNLSSLVERTTGEMRGRLVELRAGMRPTGGGFGDAIRAAGEARLATIAAMRFFDKSPAIGAVGDGHQCPVLAEKLQGAAKASLASSAILGAATAVAIAAAIGYFLLQPGALAPLMTAEAARPGIVLLPFAISILLALPLLVGPAIATMKAASDPAALLKTEPLKGLADGLRGAALSSAAETEADMIAGYADALDGLESKAGTVRHSSASNDDGPVWRRGSEAPRFVGVGFHAAPPAFTADAPKPGVMKKLFGGPRPKRGLKPRPE